MSRTTKSELISEIERLTAPQQKRVLEFARRLVARPKSEPGKRLLPFAGSIPSQDLMEISAAIEDGCERVDADAW